MKPSKNVLTIGAVIIVVLGGVLYLFMGSNNTEPVVSVAGGPTSPTEATFLGLASELETVSFSAAIFKDPRFTRLQDISTTVVNETSGRTDPFAQLQGVSSNQ